MSTRVGIFGFGRIGRNIFRILHARDDIEVGAIVDLARPEALEYLLKFDTVHGRFDGSISVRGSSMFTKGRRIRLLQSRAPGEVDWEELDVTVVIDATGRYRTRAELQRHVDAGARRVILTVPPRDELDALVLRGVNDDVLTSETRIVSHGSCTAGALAPICKVLHEAIGIEHGFLTTIHAFTGDQRLADVPHSELRRSRAAAENIIPTGTWSPQAVGRVLPELRERLDGMALCVPVPDGSCLDLVTWMRRPVQAFEINGILRSAAESGLQGILEYSEEPIVSSDVIGNPHSAIFDGLSTRVLQGNLLKTVTWYDNGWGHAARIVELIGKLAELERLATEAA